MENKNYSVAGIFIVLVFGSIITGIVSTIMTTAIPSVMNDFSIPASQAQLVTSIYSLVSGIMMLATAFIVKKYPTKRLFFIGMLLFSLGVLLCALSPTFLILIFGRILQGVGYGIIMAMTQMVILIIIPEHKRGFAMGLYGLAVMIAPVIAPVVSGIIIDNYGWRILFWIVLLMCLLDLFLGLKFMKNVLENSEQHFDLLSMILAAVGFTGVLFSVGNIGSYPFVSIHVLMYLLIGVVALIIFAIRQFKLETPLLNLRVFKTKTFTTAVIMCFILYALMNAMSTIMPIFIQTVLGESATMFGILMAPCAFIMGLLSPFTGKLYDKVGIKPLAILGCACVLISKASILFFNESSPTKILVIPLILLGFGLSGVLMNIVTFGMSDLEGSSKTDGTSILTCLRTIGAALGSAIFASILSAGVTDQKYTLANVHNSYIWMTVLAAITLFIAIFIIPGKKKSK